MIRAAGHRVQQVVPSVGRALAIAAASWTSVFIPGCAADKPPPRSAFVELTALAAEEQRFPAAASILSGFDVAGSPRDWNVGDRVLLGLRLVHPDGDRVRYLLVELTDHVNLSRSVTFDYGAGTRKGRFKSEVATTRLTLYDEQGQLIDKSMGRFPVDMLGLGLFDGAEPMIHAPKRKDGQPDLSALPPEQFERGVRGWLTLIAFSGSLNKKGMFRPILEQVIAKPSIVAMLLSPSVSIGSGGNGPEHAGEWSPAPGVRLASLRVPLYCQLAGKTCATATVQTVPAWAPLSLCGGVVRLTASNADNDRIRLEVRLLGASRGAGGQVFVRSDSDPAEE